METALYFPYIQPPQSPWFNQVLLYWDAAATIVPGSLWEHYHEPGSYMSELREAELLKYVMPWDIPGTRMDHEEGFISMFSENQATIPSGPVRNWTRIHAEKIEPRIFDDLRARGLAMPEDNNHAEYGWWRIEEKTAYIYMAYLAGVVCGRNSGFYPVTDSERSVAALIREDLARMHHR